MSEQIISVDVRGQILPVATAFRPFLLDVLPPDQLPPGVPIPSPEIAHVLQHAGGDSMVGRVGLKYLRRRNGRETVFPVCVTDKGDVPIFTSLSREEFARRYGFYPEARFVDALRGYAHAAAMITGGADAGLETARMLQAVAVYNHARPADRQRLDSVLQQDFGLPNRPSEYVQKLAFLDDALAAGDQGRKALAFFSEKRVMPLEAARDVVIKNPGLFLSYLIRTMTLWSRAAEVKNVGPLVDQLERTVGSAMEANLGQLLYRNDFVYANINTAVSLFGDLVTARRYPELYQLADGVLTDRFGIPREVRHNSRYLTSLFNRLLVKRGIVQEEDLDAGDVVARASVKTPASLLGKSVVNPRVMDTIFNGAQTLGLDVQRPDDTSLRAIKASWGIQALSRMLDQGKAGKNSKAKRPLQQVLEEVTEEMMAQDDVIRARVDFSDPAALNNAVRSVSDILGTYSPEVRGRLGKKARAEMFATWDAADKNGALVFPAEHADTERGFDPQDPAGWMSRWVIGLPHPCSFYAAAHTYFPAGVDDGELRLLGPQEAIGPRREAPLGCEIQFASQQMRPAGNLHRLFFNRDAKTGRMAHIPWDLVAFIQKKVLQDVV